MKVKPIDTTLAGQETHIPQLSMQPWNTGRFSFPPSGLNSNELPFSSVLWLVNCTLVWRIIEWWSRVERARLGKETAELLEIR